MARPNLIYPSICEVNVIFCHVPTGRKNRADFDQYIYILCIIGSNSDIWMVSRKHTNKYK